MPSSDYDPIVVGYDIVAQRHREAEEAEDREQAQLREQIELERLQEDDDEQMVTEAQEEQARGDALDAAQSWEADADPDEQWQ